MAGGLPPTPVYEVGKGGGNRTGHASSASSVGFVKVGTYDVMHCIHTTRGCSLRYVAIYGLNTASLRIVQAQNGRRM